MVNLCRRSATESPNPPGYGFRASASRSTWDFHRQAMTLLLRSEHYGNNLVQARPWTVSVEFRR